MVSPSIFVNRQEIADAVEEVTRQLSPDVQFIGFSIANDSDGKPALYFRIVLSDDASERSRSRQVGFRVEKLLDGKLQPYQRWDLYPFFDYRSASEQAELRDPAWERHAVPR